MRITPYAPGYAALAMQESVTRYGDEVQRSQGVPMQLRVGLNSGEVVVRAIGSDLHMDYTAVGQTTHLAGPHGTDGQAWLYPDHGRDTAAGGRLHPVQSRSGPYPLKGSTRRCRPLSWWAPVASGGAYRPPRRVGSPALSAATRNSQRWCKPWSRPELAMGRWSPWSGRPGWASPVSPTSFSRSHHTQGPRVLESASVCYGKATPYFPVLDLLRRYAHVDERDDARIIRAKVTGQLLTLDEEACRTPSHQLPGAA